jgi:hypothetical protein
MGHLWVAAIPLAEVDDAVRYLEGIECAKLTIFFVLRVALFTETMKARATI